MINRCQNKKLKIFRLNPALTTYNKLLRLEATYNINDQYNYNIQRNIKLYTVKFTIFAPQLSKKIFYFFYKGP